VQIFKNKWFNKFAKDEGIPDGKLWDAIMDAERGLIDADYGGGVIKQRIARPGEGKSGGYRSIILFRSGKKAFFVYGFPKNARDNINKAEEREFKALAKEVFSQSESSLQALIKRGAFVPVKRDEKSENIQE
jgi:hypothetical protein